ncbi:PREDICTED: uncharacterized protein LOC109232493 [Nicotiana attenuata]|uniref:uncharacterized protein LOC109232493 n=1 Tax=Nicotiana attenuata TaxID=49451 RepID=UPI0009059AE3|nr:PREDICTED: uncharacterized protein LOC109232493 [Nicotiana attenuata]
MEFVHRRWMYNRNHPNRAGLSDEFIEGVAEFIAKAQTLDDFIIGGGLDEVKVHLYKKGFVEIYYIWTAHGENHDSLDDANFHNSFGGEGIPISEHNVENSRYNEMMRDAFGTFPGVQSELNDEAKRFYGQLLEASRPLYEGSVHSKLSVAVRLLSIKSDRSISQAGMDSIIGLMNKLNPSNIDLPKDFYTAKKLVSKLGLSSERIDCCEKGCMLFYKDDASLENCPRNPKSLIYVYLQPLIDELQLLWHQGVETYDISTKQNFRLHVALMWTINDFPAYGMLSGWSTAGKLACPCCMEDTKAFTLKHGGKNTWFDCHHRFLPMNHEFRRNTSALMKNRTDFEEPPACLCSEKIWNRVRDMPKVTESPPSKIPGYGVTHNWTKRSIFWELPYWKHNLLRHNLDVMHIEKNFFDNLFNTIMDVTNKTKDNLKARMDLKEYCRRSELNLTYFNNKIQKPKASYTFSLDERREICSWVNNLRMPDD